MMTNDSKDQGREAFEAWAKLAGVSNETAQEAIKYCRSLKDVWGDNIEQIEAHMESDGFNDRMVAIAIEVICDE